MPDTSEDFAPDRHSTVFSVTLVVAVLATIFTGMRMLSKGWVVRRYALDDWFTVAAWIFCIGVTVSVMVGAQNGLGQVDSQISDSENEAQRRAIYCFTILYSLALMTTKTAILLLYARMAEAHIFFRRASIATMIVVNLAGAMLVLLNIFRCRPIRAGYTDEDGSCINIIYIYLSTSPINILTDIAILLLPLPILTRLRMEFRQKVVLVATFLTGGFVTVVGVVRVVYLQNALKAESAASDSDANEESSNYGYHVSFSLMWSSVEVCVGLMCCCALVLKPLVLRVLPAILKDPNRSTRFSASSAFRSNDPSQPSASGSQPFTERRFSGATADTLAAGSHGMVVPGASDMTGHTSKHSRGGVNGSHSGEGDTFDLFSMLASDPQQQLKTHIPASASVIPKKNTNSKPSKIGSVSTLLGNRKSVSAEASQEPTQTFFDFVNMGGKKPLTELTEKESRTPVIFGSTLFFLWGFAYGLIGTLNQRIQKVHGFSEPETLALSCAYWIGYFFGPLIAYRVLIRKGGFKMTFITGLAIYSAGAMAFWPSAILGSYAGFFISNFIIALGLSTLETAANPFIFLAGPGWLAEARLNFSQGVQAIGGLVSPIIASKLLFDQTTEDLLFNAQWCYLAVAFFVLLMAIVFFYVPFSEATDQELEEETRGRKERAGIEVARKCAGVNVRWLLLGLGITMMWLYIGAQENLNYHWSTLSTLIKPSFDSLWGQTISRGAFCLGRFVASALCYSGLPPRLVLLGFISGALITSLIAMSLTPSDASYACYILIEFFESPLFPTIFAMCIRDQGRHVKSASTSLIMTVSGGAVWSAVGYAINVRHQGQSRLILLPTCVIYGILLFYPIILSSKKILRRWVDPCWSKKKKEEKSLNGGTPGTTPAVTDPRGRGHEQQECFTSAPLTMGLGLNLIDEGHELASV